MSYYLNKVFVLIVLLLVLFSFLSCERTKYVYLEGDDTTPPAAITDLTIGYTYSTSITLNWRAPGDDGMEGQASSYIVKKSLVPITYENWEFAEIVIQSLLPKESGQTETLYVGDLLSNTTYYFAVVAVDDNENYSVRSNVAVGKTTHSIGNGTPYLIELDGFATSVYAADFDHDGWIDIAVTDYDYHQVEIYKNLGDSGFAFVSRFDAPGVPVFLDGADYDSDGDNDLTISTFLRNGVTAFSNNGMGFFSHLNYLPGTSNSYSVYSAHLNDDDYIDVAFTDFFSGEVKIGFNNGDGTFMAGPRFDAGAKARAVYSGDLNNDNMNDLAVVTEDGHNLVIYMNNGNGSFVFDAEYVSEIGPYTVDGGDFDNDGDIDLAVANYQMSANLSIFENIGHGKFSLSNKYSRSCHRLKVTDYDNDGDLDIVAVMSPSGNVIINYNDGSGGFEATNIIIVNSNKYSIFVADMNNDGFDDIITTRSDPHQVVILHGH